MSEKKDTKEQNMDYKFASFCMTEPEQDPDLPDSPPALLAEALQKSEVAFESYLSEFTTEEALKEEDLQELYEDGDGPENVRLLEFYTTEKDWPTADSIVSSLMKGLEEQQ